MAFISGLISLIGTAITAISAWAAASPILAGLMQSAFAIGLKYAINRLMPSKTPSTSSQIETAYGSNIPRTAVVGTCGVAGHHVYRNNYGDGGRTFQDVYVLSSFRITAVPRVKYNGRWRVLVNPDANGWYQVPNEGSSGDGYDNIRVKFYYGTMDQQPEPELIARSRPAGRWTSHHIGVGVAYAVVVSQLHKTGRGLTQPAQLLFEVVGAPLYDWRKDSTAGGSGPQRWNDQSTWQYTANNAVQIYNLQRGFFNGDQLMVGKGVRAERLPLAEYTLAANICDELVDGSYRYRAHMIAKDGPSSNHDSNLQPLLEAMCGSWIERVDGEFPIAGAPQAIVATITDADINLDMPFRFTKKRKRTELINTVAATYVSPDDFYETKDAATRINQAALDEDRETLASAIPYGAVTDSKQVDRLADIAIRGARFQASAEFTIHPRFLDVVKEGRWIRYVSEEYGTYVFQVMSRTLGPHLSESPRAISLYLQEISNGVFDPTAYATAPPVIIVVPPPTYLAQVQNFTATPNVVEASGGGLLPGVSMRWAAIEDISVSGVLIEYWPVANPAQVFTKVVDSDISVVQIVEGLTSETDWQARTTLMVNNGRSVAPSGLTNFRTLQAGGDFVADLEHLGQDVKDVISQMGGQAREFFQKLEQIGQAVTLEGALSQVERDEMRTEMGKAFAAIETVREVSANEDEALARQITTVSAGVAGNAAKIATEETARATGDSANAKAITALSASVRDNTAAIATESQARADAVSSLASQVTGVQASVGDVSAGGLVSYKAVAAPSGVDVRIASILRTSVGGAEKSAGEFLEIYTEGGVQKARKAFNVDQFAVTDGVNSYALLAIEDGQVKILKAMIKQAQIEDLFVKGEQIEPGAVSSVVSAVGPTSQGAVNVDLLCKFPTVENEGDVRIVFDVQSILISRVSSGGSNRTGTMTLTNVSTGQTLRQLGLNQAPPFAIPLSWKALVIPPKFTNEVTLRLSTFGSSGAEWEAPTALATILKR